MEERKPRIKSFKLNAQKLDKRNSKIGDVIGKGERYKGQRDAGDMTEITHSFVGDE